MPDATVGDGSPLRQARCLTLLFLLHFPEMAVLPHGVSECLSPRVMAGENLQLAAAIIVEVGNDGLVMLEQLPGENRVTAGADKAHDTKDL